MEYIFTLKYRLAEGAGDVDDLVERLGAGGCDDSLIGIGTPGRIALEFTRDAPDARTAMVSALQDVKRAIPTARLIEASPDFVGLSDVAELVGVTRQNMRKLMVSSSSFPMPVHEGSAAIWHLADILSWLDAKGNYNFERSILDVAKTAMLLNFAKESRQQESTIPHDIWELTA